VTSAVVRRAAQLGLIGQVVFVLSFLVAGLWQGPRYSFLAHVMSDMYAETAPGGWFLVVMFTFCGVATVLFAALAVWPTLRPSKWWGAAAAIVLGLSIYGLGDVLSPFEREACRLADPGCTATSQLANAGGNLDNTLSFPGILLFLVAVFLIASAMKRTPGWKSWVWPIRWAGGAFFVVLVLDTVAYGLQWHLDGLMERLLATTGCAILGAFAWGIQAALGESVGREGTGPSVQLQS
jgi:hypothetical protein